MANNINLDQLAEQMNVALARHAQQTADGIKLSSQDLIQVFERIMTPDNNYGNIITKDLKTANLDSKQLMIIIAQKSIAKDFIVFRDSFNLENDKWINATISSINADSEITISGSQGYKAKLLDTFVTFKRESRVVTEMDKNKKGVFDK